jgi:LPS sulfotransferase NodH
MIQSSLAETPAQSYIICAGPRTGSNLLATALRRTRIAGWPLEYFNMGSANRPFMLNELSLERDRGGTVDFSARLPHILRKGTLGGIFGATVHLSDKDHLHGAICGAYPAAAGAIFADALHAALPRLHFIWLRRADKLAQAISHHTAKISGVWQQSAEAGDGDDAPEIPFDFDEITDLLNQAVTEDEGWRGVLAGQEAHTLALTYEEFAADYAGTLTSVLAFLGLDVPPGGLPDPPYQRQANERSAELTELYQAEAERRAPQNRTAF